MHHKILQMDAPRVLDEFCDISLSAVLPQLHGCMNKLAYCSGGQGEIKYEEKPLEW